MYQPDAFAADFLQVGRLSDKAQKSGPPARFPQQIETLLFR
jgi:hypothetical protein